MGRVIEGSPAVKTDFPPSVGLLEIGDFVKGKVVDSKVTKNGNPVLSLELIDLKGNTTKSVSKGVYAEVDVKIGDIVNVIGHVTDLKEKLPKVAVGEIVTILFEKTTKVKKGNMKNFVVTIE